MTESGVHDAAVRLPRLLTVLYVLLVGYACLYPLDPWQASGLPPLDYLWEPWPKYFRTADLVLNVLGYVPFGFLFATVVRRQLRGMACFVLTVAVAATLSFAIETTQNYLPSRVASNVNLGLNVAGGAIGAVLGCLWGHNLFGPQAWPVRWRARHIIPGHSGDLGLLLVALWLLAQLMPEELLFGGGDVRQLLHIATPLPFEPERYLHLEAGLVTASLLAIGLFARCILRPPHTLPIIVLIALGIAAKTLASHAFFVPAAPTAWLTPGTQRGLWIGCLLLLLALRLPRITQHALAGTSLLVMSVLTNLVPDNPYLALDPALPERGNFLNFHGLTAIVAALWPFVALAYLSALGLWRGEHLDQR